jgi:hypothetical protein
MDRGSIHESCTRGSGSLLAATRGCLRWRIVRHSVRSRPETKGTPGAARFHPGWCVDELWSWLAQEPRGVLLSWWKMVPALALLVSRLVGIECCASSSLIRHVNEVRHQFDGVAIAIHRRSKSQAPSSRSTNRHAPSAGLMLRCLEPKESADAKDQVGHRFRACCRGPGNRCLLRRSEG